MLMEVGRNKCKCVSWLKNIKGGIQLGTVGSLLRWAPLIQYLLLPVTLPVGFFDFPLFLFIHFLIILNSPIALRCSCCLLPQHTWSLWLQQCTLLKNPISPNLLLSIFLFSHQSISFYNFPLKKLHGSV